MNHAAMSLALLCLTALGSCKTTSEEGARPSARDPSAPSNVAASSLIVTSTAFTDGGALPTRFTCEGENVSPPLAWSDPPVGTKSFAIVFDDPDAMDPRASSTAPFAHWIVYDLPHGTRALPEAVQHAPLGGRDGLNDFGRTGYGGPCPPAGKHRYVVHVHALDVMLPELTLPRAADLERAMKEHVLALGHLAGTYERGRGPRT